MLCFLLCLLTSDLLSSFFELRFPNFMYGASMPVADSLNLGHPGCTFTLFFRFGSFHWRCSQCDVVVIMCCCCGISCPMTSVVCLHSLVVFVVVVVVVGVI